MSEPIVGIDLGTTFSVVAYLDREGKPRTILNEEGESLTPSVVFFDRTSTIVGREAVKAAEFEPQRFANFAKRDMGDAAYHKQILGHSFPPEVIQAIVLQKLKRDAETKLGPVRQAVITVPAYFNEPRRKATQDAGRMAGLEVLDIVNEPTAAAIAFGVEQGFLAADGETHKPERVLVYDLGGGTFDLTLMDVAARRFHAAATAGDMQLGGVDWDERLAKYLAEQFRREHKFDLQQEPAGWERLLHTAAETKRALSAREESLAVVTHDGRSSRVKVTRQVFESLTADLLDRTRLTLRRLLKDANVAWGEITRVLLVGGSTRMPMVARMLEAESGKRVDRSLSPDEAVAHGAAIYAGMLDRRSEQTGDGFSVRNVNSHHLGVLGIDPATRATRRQIMIPRNTPLPALQRRSFQTSKENQRDVVVVVVEGGTDKGEGATRIGKCIVGPLPAGLAKGTSVQVTFRYRGDGRLEVAAEVPSAKCQAEMTIDRAAGLPEEQLQEWQQRLVTGLQIDDDAALAEELAEMIIDEDLADFLAAPDDEASESEVAKPTSPAVNSNSPPADAALSEFLKRLR